MNGIQDRGALTNLLMRRLNMTGDAPAAALIPEVGPQLVLENDRPEWRYLKGENYFSSEASVAAVVAEFSVFYLPVVAGSDQIVVIEQIDTTVQAVVGITQTAPVFTLTALSNSHSRDSRAPTFAVAAFQSGTTVANPTITRRLALSMLTSTVNARLQQPIIISPGWGLIVRASTNTAASCSIYGYTRRAQPGELD